MNEREISCDTCKYGSLEPNEGARVGCHYYEHYEKNEPEMVDHPAHYNRDGAMECIDEMVLVFGVKATMIFCLLSSWKYRYRASDKGGTEDLRKSDWFIHEYVALGKKHGENESIWEC